MDCPHFPPNVWPKEYIDKPTLFKTVTLPADFGDDEANPPKVGAYRNVILNYLANNHTYIYSSDGIPVLITGNAGGGGGEGTVKSVNNIEPDTAGNVTLSPSDIGAPTTEALSAEIAERQEGDTLLQSAIDTKQDALSQTQLAAVNSGIDSTKVAQIATNASDIDTIEGKIPSAATAQNQLADKSYVDTADNGLQSQIDAISASSDVKDIVGTKAELNSYDTSTLGDNDIIKVLQDESENDATTYYRWSTSTNSFTLIGEEGPYYTKSQANALLDNKVDKVTGKGLSTNDFTDADVTKLASIEAGAEANVQSNWAETDTSSDAYIQNKPTNLVQDASYVHTDNNFTTTLKDKLDGIEAGAEVNTIDSISVNGTAVTPDANKNVDILIPDGVLLLDVDNHTLTTDELQAFKDAWDSREPIFIHYGAIGGQIVHPETGNTLDWAQPQTFSAIMGLRTASNSISNPKLQGGAVTFTPSTMKISFSWNVTSSLPMEGDSSLSTTTNANTWVKKSAIRNYVGDLTALTTTDKTSTVAAINEIDANLPVITMTTTDPGEGSPLVANHFIGVYE